MRKDVETSLLIIEDLLRDYELACKEAEQWWIEYKARKQHEELIDAVPQ